MTMLATMRLLSVPAPALRAQENVSLRDQMKARQKQEAGALKAQHKLEMDSAKSQHLSKAQQKQMQKSMKQQNRQMRQRHKAQWRDLKAQDRWNKQHEKEHRATPNS
jgi:hypothetical protein